MNDENKRIVVQSDVEMADDILLLVQEHFCKPHPDVKHCNCADRLRAARMYLREAISIARGD